MISPGFRGSRIWGPSVGVSLAPACSPPVLAGALVSGAGPLSGDFPTVMAPGVCPWLGGTQFLPEPCHDVWELLSPRASSWGQLYPAPRGRSAGSGDIGLLQLSTRGSRPLTGRDPGARDPLQRPERPPMAKNSLAPNVKMLLPTPAGHRGSSAAFYGLGPQAAPLPWPRRAGPASSLCARGQHAALNARRQGLSGHPGGS